MYVYLWYVLESLALDLAQLLARRAADRVAGADVCRAIGAVAQRCVGVEFEARDRLLVR